MCLKDYYPAHFGKLQASIFVAMANNVYDYLIVGQGIAGSVMAMTLVEQHQSVYLVDSPKPNTSSRIAAGIMNPITGKRMTLTWEAESFFLEAIAFYSRMEERFGDNFLFEKPIVRIFSSVAEQNDWTGKCQDKKYTGFIKSGALDHGSYTGVETPYGSMQVTGGGRLDTNLFLDNVRSYFIDKNQFVESEVEMSDVKTENGKVTWKNITANLPIA